MNRNITAHRSIQNNLGATQLHIQLSIQGGVHKRNSNSNSSSDSPPNLGWRVGHCWEVTPPPRHSWTPCTPLDPLNLVLDPLHAHPSWTPGLACASTPLKLVLLTVLDLPFFMLDPRLMRCLFLMPDPCLLDPISLFLTDER